MKRSRKIGIGIAVALILGFGALYALARSSTPDVPLERDVEREDAAAIREVLRALGDPRDYEDGAVLEVRLSQRQLSALAAEVSRREPRASARVRLEPSSVAVTVSARSPWPWLTPFVNVRASVSGPPSAPVVERATLGALPIPAAFGQALLDRAYAEALRREPLLAAAADATEELRYGSDAVVVTARWSPEVRAQLREGGRRLVASELGGAAVEAYAEALRPVVSERRSEEPRHLGSLLVPVFREAVARVERGGDRRRELEAALLLLTLYCLDKPLADVLGEDAPPPLPSRTVLLHGRDDLPRHFLVSALTALMANPALSDALGLAKELRDSEDADGSGFSFRDLAADRAGTRLVASATQSPARLGALLTRLSQPPLIDADLVPPVDDLPEGMDQAAFEAAYQDVDGESYRSMRAVIDARVDACAVHATVEAAR